MVPTSDWPPLVRPEAAALVADAIGGRRVLVTGASGWFGRTMVALLVAGGRRTDEHGLMCVASRGRVETVAGVGDVPVRAWAHDEVVEFAPEVVINCAFLTRDKVELLGRDRYSEAVTRLSQRFLETVQLPSVSHVVSISSGASLTAWGDAETDARANPYGFRKAVEERDLMAAASERGIGATVLRAWAMSGPFVQRPRDYLFSSLVVQALAARSRPGATIQVDSAAPVWRKFAAVDEALAVAIAVARRGGVTLVDTGGPLVEAGGLARRVIELLAPGATVQRPQARDGDVENRYFAEGDAYEAQCRDVGLSPSDLDDQILRTAALLSRGVAA